MRDLLRCVASTLLLSALAGCAPKGAPASLPTAAAPPPVRIPPGCEADQSGVYVHVRDPAFHYLGQDDGGTLLLSVQRRSPDGGTAPDEAQLRLERTPRGFVGTTRARTFTASGRPCPGEFPTEVMACGDGGLLLRSASSAAVDEACHPPAAPPPSVMVEERLIRVEPGGTRRDGGPARDGG